MDDVTVYKRLALDIWTRCTGRKRACFRRGLDLLCSNWPPSAHANDEMIQFDAISAEFHLTFGNTFGLIINLYSNCTN